MTDLFYWKRGEKEINSGGDPGRDFLWRWRHDLVHPALACSSSYSKPAGLRAAQTEQWWFGRS
jgi:hypothetical protein